MEKLTVIKVGGKIVEEEATLYKLLDDFAAIEGYKVLVHGGGRSATKLAAQLGIESKMVNGRRITDAETLKVVTMVYGGLVNKNMREKLTVIKVGGKIVEEEATLHKLLDDFAAIEGYKVLVHGGGRSATKLAAQLGIESQMVNGRRITDAETLKVVTMVYGGLVNKNIVAGLQARGVNALGLTGADMDVIRSVKRPVKEVDYGFVGDVKQVNDAFLADLIHKGVVPVMAPLTHDGDGHMLNTNADTIAGETAKALAGLFDVTLVFCFEKKGVLRSEDDDDSVIPQITPEEFKQYVADGVIQGGMIPKLENSFEALNAGVSEVVITLASAINGNSGTRIRK